mgnify:CR=1 FL=1
MKAYRVAEGRVIPLEPIEADRRCRAEEEVTGSLRSQRRDSKERWVEGLSANCIAEV